MANSASKASFSFVSHKVKKLVFSAPEIEPDDLSVTFSPSGVYKTKEGLFILTLIVEAKYGEKDEHSFATITAEGLFKFQEETKIEDLPDFFYPNSIAILFPYLRAFITVLTSVGNIKPLILPTLNLSSLANPLKESTLEV